MIQITETITKKRSCSGCTMCCKLLGIVELQKPRVSWCPHCEIGVGCQIYETRPETCRAFECLWLQPEAVEFLGDEDRPDKTGVVLFTPDDADTLQVHVDPHKPDNWKKGATAKLIRAFSGSGQIVLITIGNDRKMLGSDKQVKALRAADIQIKIQE